jgi:ribonuclease Z
MLAVTILGNNSAIPAFGRHPTAQAVITLEQTFLVDCGEGTQMQMNNYKIRHSRVNHIFISHLHGDHYFGLIGLLTTMGLLGRKVELHLYAPPQLIDVINLQFKVSDSHLPYQLHFHPLNGDDLLFEDKKIRISSFKVFHRIDCWGFLFHEKRFLRKIDAQKANRYNIPLSFYENLHRGEDYLTPGNTLIPNAELTVEGPHATSYAYCADTGYNELVSEKVRGVDVMYHEATYLHEFEDRAHARFHSTSKQAAMVAQKAGAKRLLLGHFSSKYEELDDFKTEACTIFPQTELAIEGVTYLI